MSRTPEPVLDHIVILVSSQVLANLPAWLTDSLVVLSGGTHSDGLTDNKLIIFEDGVYIELIAFVEGIDPDKRRSHRWGRKVEGQVIDWACTLLQNDPEEQFSTIRDRVLSAKAGFNYPNPVPGGRITPDGTELKWAISAPSVDKSESAPDLQLTGGELPFWCLDRTPRHLRVPHADPNNLRHPSGAVGVATVSIYVKGSEELAHLRRVYDAIADRLAEVKPMSSVYSWRVQVPFPNSAPQSGLILRRLSEESLDQGATSSDSVHIRIALFTKKKNGRLEGSIGKAGKLVVDLIPLAEERAA